MPTSYLTLVNQVMVRLREPEISSVSQNKYSKLVGALVNDAKRAVEDAAYWNALWDTWSITTSSGTADYIVTGSNERTTIVDVFRENPNVILHRRTARELIQAKQLETTNGKPTQWAVISDGAAGVRNIRFSPTPNGAYDMTVSFYAPEDDLSADTDTTVCPAEPIYMRAYAYAIKERGEDNGQRFQEALDQAQRVLARYMILNNHSNGGSGQWQIV